jgi:hypothetical protein
VDEQGAPHTWPREWLANLGREAGGDTDRPMTTTDRLRQRIAQLEAENAQLRMETLMPEAGSATMRDMPDPSCYSGPVQVTYAPISGLPAA